ncbi:MAG: AraC family transcriptional regulator [Verrucomicrobiota bacterium]
MWGELPSDEKRDWDRQWFGHELTPEAAFNVRGIGIREPLFNPDVHRPLGTGDWLIMFFHEPPRLERRNPVASHPAGTLIIWTPGAEQFYSWGESPDAEPHSWMHVEGTWVAQQIDAMELPVNAPMSLPDESVMVATLTALLEEMQRDESADSVILQNLFENWARGIRRQLRPRTEAVIPPALVRVRRHLDADFRRIPPLDELTELAAMSRSHLCHRFKECYGFSISEYVIRKRMSAAQRMLYDVDRRPGEIAEAVGYPDIYQFSKQFKKTFGVSPTQYRKQQRVSS